MGQAVTPDQLNAVMEFDRVIRVEPDDTVTTDVKSDATWTCPYPPDLYDGHLTGGSARWSLMSGYTNQQGGGDVLHNSEFIGGGLARDILATPGLYVAVVANWSCEEHPDDECECDTMEGWGVARIVD
jgi:hypothetical protein